jgi:hypothetical protein
MSFTNCTNFYSNDILGSSSTLILHRSIQNHSGFLGFLSAKIDANMAIA